MSNIDKVRIRMYHTGSVGDCFLLLFEKAGATSFSMLIDCGGYKTKKDLISKAAQDIKDSILNNTIDLVVITHEHEDHLSGFNLARTTFDSISFKQVWMSWAENKKDPLAIQLFKEKGKKIKALRKLIESKLASVKKSQHSGLLHPRLRRSFGIRRTNMEHALEMLSFDDETSLTGSAATLKISDAIQYVKDKSKVKTKSKMYKKPGQVIKDLVGAEGLKFFMLGPPYDTDLHGIKNDEDHSEMYALRKKLGLSTENFLLNILDTADNRSLSLTSPFAFEYHMNAKAKKEYMATFYNKRENKWRQIEYDWLDSANEVSIALTDFVNNTSLAFAIELPNGKVLLFPADAQSGNWMSWHDNDVEKALKNNGGRTAAELLEKTIFYKVGHHGSHNGTAKGSGLERMKEKKIVAFMPLVQDKVPAAWGGSDNFPAQPLYLKIIEKTNGAVIRTDTGLVNDHNAPDLRTNKYSDAEIKKMKDASKNPLYHEWIVSV
jgi:beta-lactamase superfamily II metal-dependent hydrolase